MAISDVKVKIDLLKPIGKAGFGIPLILTGKATTAIAYTECSNLADVKTAGYAETTETYKAAQLIFMQDDAPDKIAVCSATTDVKAWLTDVDNQSKGWRQCIVTSIKTTGETKLADLVSTFETLDGKMLFVSVDNDETLSGVTVSGINRTVFFFVTDSNYNNPAAAWVGETAGLTPGSFTYKNIILKGIEPQNLKDSEITAIHTKGGNTFVTKAGDNVTSEGKTAGGEYIDIVDCQDWIVQQIEYRTQKLLNTMPKLPYDNKGIAMLENVCLTVLKEAANMGMIAYDDEAGKYLYSTNFALREDTDESDRAVRKYIGGRFNFSLAGAIHTVEVEGEIII